MKTGHAIVLGVVFGLVSHAALALQESKGGTQDKSDPTAGLSAPAPEQPGRGQEIRVPGLGTIGVLPKLDFGLELLYGANNPQGGTAPSDEKSESGAQIRGTLKYRFPN